MPPPLRSLALAACLPFAGPALAGLGLDESLQRHRELLEGALSGTSTPTCSTPQLTLPDSVTLAVGGEKSDALPPFSRPQVRGRGGVQVLFGDGDPNGFAWRLGVGWTDSDHYHYNLDGSELSARFGNGRVYLSDQRRHWGPSWAGSLILDDGAAPIPALGWRKTDPSAFAHPWLNWLGAWNLDVFVGTLAGHTEPAHPKLWGTRFQFMPLDGLEIGLSRVLEWGGRGRSESFDTFWRSIIGQDNVDGGRYDPGNQLAGFDARYTFAVTSTAAVSLYGQAIGEDEAGLLPSKYLGSLAPTWRSRATAGRCACSSNTRTRWRTGSSGATSRALRTGMGSTCRVTPTSAGRWASRPAATSPFTPSACCSTRRGSRASR